MANEKRDAKAMRSFLAVAAIALAAAVLVPRYMTQRTTVSAAPPMMAAHIDAPAQTASSDSRSVVVAPDSQGHFRVEARVDNRRMDFLVDTGASVIALTARDAATLGIHPADSEYTMAVRTANGTVHAAPVNLNMVDIGGITVRDVSAIVLPEDALSDNLLGMAFLSRLHRYEYSGGKLVLQQ
jgi:aspartyl protease family protein